MNKLTQLILDDMRPALGVTEPGAIAFAVATAREHASGTLQEIHIILNSGMYKNAFTCGIPNSNEVGNAHAAALGYVAGDASKGLECLDGVTRRHNMLVKELLKEGKVIVTLGEISSRIYIHVIITTNEGTATVTIRDAHTNIIEITENGRVVFSQRQKEGVKVIKSRRTTFAHYLYNKNGQQIISSDEQTSASLLCNAAIEARVLGLPHPAMSITGSGAHGIIATLPLYASARVNGYTNEQLLRATALSYLVCMYIKEYSGKLSAFCGCAIAAGTGMACGLAYLKGGTLKTLTLTIQNMASSITGMICDGGNHGCTMKGIVAVDAAYQSVGLALEGIAIGHVHGINGKTPEETMRNMGLIASPGMVKTEGVIVDIMKGKQ